MLLDASIVCYKNESAGIIIALHPASRWSCLSD